MEPKWEDNGFRVDLFRRDADGELEFANADYLNALEAEREEAKALLQDAYSSLVSGGWQNFQAERIRQFLSRLQPETAEASRE